jgi:thiol-disulfide isomerase/thioredoxin
MRFRMNNSALVLAAGITLLLASCGGAGGATHGTISDLSTDTATPGHLCEHDVPADVCVRCNPELEPRFREANDWCGPHRVPESQCHRCHPNLDFSPLPDIPESADVRDLSHEEALAGLSDHAAEGKITIFDFHANWCAACFNLDRHLRTWLGETDQLAIRRIDVAEWSWPVVDRYLAEVEMLPYVVILGPDGSEIARMSNFGLDELDDVLNEAIGE